LPRRKRGEKTISNVDREGGGGNKRIPPLMERKKERGKKILFLTAKYILLIE